MRTIEEINADMEHLEQCGLDTVDLYDRIIDYLSELVTHKQSARALCGINKHIEPCDGCGFCTNVKGGAKND